jgi:5-methylcytosine-specific restriction endonuclease McrA
MSWYSEQLKNPKWQRKRLEILERDDFKCQGCGNTDQTLHVHHYRYIKGKLYWDYDDELLVTLCDFCHKDWHKLDGHIERHLHRPYIEQCELFILLESYYMLDSKRRRNLAISLYEEANPSFKSTTHKP